METLEIKNVGQKRRIAYAIVAVGIVIEAIGAIWLNMPQYNVFHFDAVGAVVVLMSGAAAGLVGAGVVFTLPEKPKGSMAQ